MQEPNVHNWFHAFSAEKTRQGAVDRSRAATLRDSEALLRIVDVVRDHYRTSFAAISIINRRSQLLIAERGFGFVETARSAAFCAVTIQQGGEALIVPDARADPRFVDYASVIGDPYIRFYAGVPIHDDDGIALGALCIADSAPRADAFDRALLDRMARETERAIAETLPPEPPAVPTPWRLRLDSDG